VWREKYPEESADAAGGKLARQATAALAGLLSKRGMTRKDLAQRMNVSPGRVSQILSGDENLTLRSLAAVAEALGTRVEIHFVDPSRPAASGAGGQGGIMGTGAAQADSSLPYPAVARPDVA
jgi:transcriptional regulator with XRE-family HTH domain